ncbi:IGR protein domain-containing protein [Phlyctema vagabunda]|uniref:Small ribosomal subunit protein mS41 n=1 Tax=Phlyctema vagabunda TaxID=108571 RepID=A0ABR4PZB9_9HELO
MLIKPAQLRPIPFFLLPFAQSTSIQARNLHQRVSAGPIPSPTPFVPDPQTFLTLIGRNLSKHAASIPTWEALFTLSSPELQQLGVEPARSRRYLLRWREKFRKGEYGIGGDLKHVENGVAEVRAVEVPIPGKSALEQRKVVVNVPAGVSPLQIQRHDLVPVKGLHVKGARTVVGPSVLPAKGGIVSKIKVKEGLWEDRRGVKIDGGERRQAEVRAKRRGEERKAR